MMNIWNIKSNGSMISGLKNKLLILLSLTSLLLFTGFTFPDNAPYLIINCSLQNNLKIYFNTSSADNKIVYDADQKLLINCYTSSIYGYTEINGTEYQIYFPTYDTPYYRTGNNYTYVYITDVEIVTNKGVKFYKSFDDSTIMASAVIILLFFIFLKGGH